MSHSKRNTSRAVFTSHERDLAKANWSSTTARLNRDSFLPFGSCGLCLEIAREPVSCQLGDIFCRECALANILAQKKELKRAEKAGRQASEDAARVKAAKDNEDRQRAVQDFELTQAGLDTSGKSVPSDMIDAKHQVDASSHAGAKRKFALDEDELSRIATEDRAKARRAIDSEKAGKRTLPSFWTPSLTPDVRDDYLPDTNKKIKTIPICPTSMEGNQHAISMQKLVTIQFRQDTDQSNRNKHWSCPSCLKPLTNSSNPVMTQQCGHVLCLSCVKKFLIPPKKKTGSDLSEPEMPIICYVCDALVTGKPMKHDSSATQLPAGLVTLRSEGTGFSACGSNTVEKQGIGFQC